MINSPLKDFASGVLFGTTPGVTRPTVAAPSPFDDEEVDRRYEKFGITRYADSSSYSSTGSGAYSQTDGTDPYRGPLSVSGMTQSVADQFVGMDKKLGAAISPLGFNPLISAGSFISKKNLENIEKNIAEGNSGYALGMLDGKIIGVSPGLFGGSVLSGVLPSGLSAEQRRQLTSNLLSTRETAENPKDFAVSPTPTPESTDAEMASAGSANIVTDSSGRPVTQGGDPSSSGYGSYVTTGQGQYVDPSVIQDQGDAMTAAAEAAAPYANMTEDDFNPSDPGGSGGSTSQDFSAPSYDYDDFSGTPFASGGEASKDPVQSTGFVDGPPQNYAKGTTVADTENHRVRVGSFVLNAPTTERLQKEGKLPKGPQKRKAAKGGKMMDVALSKGEYVIDVDDIGKFGGYAVLEKENDKGKPEVERRQAAAQGGFLGGYQKGGEVNRRDESLADVELRADLETFIRKDQLARLGWYLYTTDQLKIAGLPVDSDYTRSPEPVEKGYEVVDPSYYPVAGVYNPSPGRNERPVYPQGVGYSAEQEAKRIKLNPSTTPSRMFVPLLEKLGIVPSETARATYFAEPMYIPDRYVSRDGSIKSGRTDEKVFMGDRASVMITLAHELRHAAMNYLHYEHGAPRLTMRQEESMMDVVDDRGRRDAATRDSSVNPISPFSEMAQRADVAKYDRFPQKQVEIYDNLAGKVLKQKKVPPAVQPKEKGLINNFLNDFFKKSITNKRDNTPVDYTSEALQSPQF